MNCNRESQCGFYKELIKMKIIEQGRPCGKPNPLVCPRHRFANGIDVAQAQKVLKVQDVIGNSSALTYEEIGLMYPNEKGGDSNG